MGSAEKFPNVLPSYINGHPSTKQNTRTIVDIQQLLKQMDTFHCRCGGHLQTKAKVVEKKRCGFSVYIESMCDMCDRKSGTYTSEHMPCFRSVTGMPTLQRMKPG